MTYPESIELSSQVGEKAFKTHVFYTILYSGTTLSPKKLEEYYQLELAVEKERKEKKIKDFYSIDNGKLIFFVHTKDRGFIPSGLFSLMPALAHYENIYYSHLIQDENKLLSKYRIEIEPNNYQTAIMETNISIEEFFRKKKKVISRTQTAHNKIASLVEMTSNIDELEFEVFMQSYADLMNFGLKSKSVFQQMLMDGIGKIRAVYLEDYLVAYILTTQTTKDYVWDLTVFTKETREHMNKFNLRKYLIVEMWKEARSLGKRFNFGMMDDYSYKERWIDTTDWVSGLKMIE